MSEDKKVEVKPEAKAKKEAKPEPTVADIRAEIEELGGEMPAASEPKAAQQKALDTIRKKMGIKSYATDASEQQASTIAATFKLSDRRCVDVGNGDVYANPRQLWGQGDNAPGVGPLNRGVKGRVAGQLYAAARKGEFPIIEAKGVDGVVYKFQLLLGVLAEDPEFDAGDPLKAIGARQPAPKKEKKTKASKAKGKGKKSKSKAPAGADISPEQIAADEAALDAKLAAAKS